MKSLDDLITILIDEIEERVIAGTSPLEVETVSYDSDGTYCLTRVHLTHNPKNNTVDVAGIDDGTRFTRLSYLSLSDLARIIEHL